MIIVEALIFTGAALAGICIGIGIVAIFQVFVLDPLEERARKCNAELAAKLKL